MPPMSQLAEGGGFEFRHISFSFVYRRLIRSNRAITIVVYLRVGRFCENSKRSEFFSPCR